MTANRKIPRNLGFSDDIVKMLFEGSNVPDTHKELFDNTLVPLYTLTNHISQTDDSVFQIRELENANIHAAMSLRTSNTAFIASAFYELGQVIERFRWNTNTSYKDMVQTVMSRQKQKSGIRQLNLKRNQAKKLAQKVAAQAWKEDVKKEMRITSMCEFVWNDLVGDIMSPEYENAFPDDAHGLKDWLREIAPKYARSPGRPPSKKRKS